MHTEEWNVARCEHKERDTEAILKAAAYATASTYHCKNNSQRFSFSYSVLFLSFSDDSQIPRQ